MFLKIILALVLSPIAWKGPVSLVGCNADIIKVEIWSQLSDMIRYVSDPFGYNVIYLMSGSLNHYTAKRGTGDTFRSRIVIESIPTAVHVGNLKHRGLIGIMQEPWPA